MPAGNVLITATPGLTTLLGVALIALKAVGYLHWSWLWVLAPFWAPLGLALFVSLAVLTFVAVTCRPYGGPPGGSDA